MDKFYLSSKKENQKELQRELIHYMMQNITNEIESETILMTDTREFRRNAICKLCENDIFEMPTQGLLTEWLIDFSTSELVKLIRHGKDISNLPRQTALISIPGECHSTSVLNWFLNEVSEDNKKNLSVYTGIADKAFAHSWLVDEDEQIILEPTPVDREIYYGFRVEDPMRFFLSELNTIFGLMQIGMIGEQVSEYFKKKFMKYFEDINFKA